MGRWDDTLVLVGLVDRLDGWNGWNSLGNRVWGNGAYLGNGLGNGGVLAHGQSVRYIYRA